MEELLKLLEYHENIDYTQVDVNQYKTQIEDCASKMLDETFAALENKQFDYVVKELDGFIFRVKKQLGDSFSERAKNIFAGTSRYLSNFSSYTYMGDRFLALWLSCLRNKMDSILKPLAFYPDENNNACLYYNFWGDDMESYAKNALSTLGATDRQRASFDVCYNVSLFQDEYIIVSNDAHSKDETSYSHNLRSHSLPIVNFLQNQFGNYIYRFSKEHADLASIENAGCGWLFFTRRHCSKAEQSISREQVYDSSLYSIIVGIKRNYLSDIARRKKVIDKNHQDVKVQERIISSSHIAKGIRFSEYLSVKQIEILKSRLHAELEVHPGYKGLIYIRAAIINKYIENPSYPELMETFPNITTKERNYSGFMGSTGKLVVDISEKHKDMIDTAVANLERLVKKSQ